LIAQLRQSGHSNANRTDSATLFHPLVSSYTTNQAFTFAYGSEPVTVVLPNSQEAVLPGVLWGNPGQLFTPAYWFAQCCIQERHGSCSRNMLGGSFVEEVAACLLGGYGMKAELGLAAFQRLRERDLLSGEPVEERKILKALTEPLRICGREVRYRFPKQRSRYISEAIRRVQNDEPPTEDRKLRDWLTDFPGVGLKTASWITRNWKGSDAVAIIDIHICRAGQMIGLFGKQTPNRDYLELEALFLSFAQVLQVRASQLDNLIWNQMRTWGRLALPVARGRRKTT
jgi:N-glycosylase/DNA lyase